ncbi:MAG: hypothetical protein IIY49_06360 [Eubacterium sp.]|nr:hypothetical protein [Eubacterium sp.]
MAKSFKSEFVKFYKEKLDPYGFKKVKGPQPYFARLVNGEIVHIITYRGVRTNTPGYKSFELNCGIASIYRKRIRFDVTPDSNSYCLKCNTTMEELKDHYYRISIKKRKFYDFKYTEETMQMALEKSLIEAKFIIEQLDKYTDMESTLEFFMKHNGGFNVTFSDLLSDSFSDEEGLYYARREFDAALIEKCFSDMKKDVELIEDEYDKEFYKKELYNGCEERFVTNRKNFQADEELYNEGMKTLQQRKEDNLKMLKEYKVI